MTKVTDLFLAIGVLPCDATLKVGETQKIGYCKVLEVMDYRCVPTLPNGPDGKPTGYVFSINSKHS